MPEDHHDTRHDTRPLGRTGIHVLPLGIGTNKWRRADRGAVLETYRTIHDAGPCMIDTAEIYFAERVVGDCLRTGPTRAVIASKFLPLPGRTSPRRLMSALDGSLARLGLKTIDLYYVHYPLPLIDVGVFAEGLVEAVKSGKARAVGVANFNADQMRRIADHLARAGVPLAANQGNYSLLRRGAEQMACSKPAVSSMWHWSRIFPLRPAASRGRRTAWARKRCWRVSPILPARTTPASARSP